MSERFELSFKNKEVRMWFYLMLPVLILGTGIFFFLEYRYQPIAYLLAAIAWIIYFVWRYFYRKKNRKLS